MNIPGWVRSSKTPRLRGTKKIPIYSPIFTGLEKEYVLSCLESGWISSKGDFVERFEQAFARAVGATYAVATSSGTAALFLALKSLGVGSGDEVIVPTFTMVSTAFAVSYCGATPVFVDCEPKTGNIDIGQIEAAVTARTRAIIPVHIYGNPCRLGDIHKIATKHHLAVLEDAAEAFGASYKGKRIGGTGEMTAFSLYVNKIVTTGEGGMITLSSKRLYNLLKHLNNYSFSPVRHFWHDRVGYNFRMSNVEAAIGLAQLEYADRVIEKKKEIARWYGDFLQKLADRFTPLGTTSQASSNYWHIAYRLTDDSIDRQALCQHLAHDGIETRTFFIPLHLQPVYRELAGLQKYPNAELFGRTGILLPSGPGLTKDEINYICDTIHDCLQT